MDERLHAVVRGDVQGVGFRDFVQRRASAAGLKGSVRNRADGTLEVVAEGPPPALDQLLEDLRRGPRAARVDHVETERGRATGEHREFRISF